ncbi:NACHT domain-containing protein [Agrobacterium vitis]
MRATINSTFDVMTIVPLDRRVNIRLESETVEFHLSELRDRPYVVLLGEPGLGKSTALQHEAMQEGGEVVTCREVMNGVAISSSQTAYLDALDEYRAGDGGKDKLLQLATAISDSTVGRWRLTCRAEDWRAAGDLQQMRRAANNQPIIVAHLLPLDDEEAEAVLAGLGEPDPEKFIADTRGRGAIAFLENPLSLSLLHSVVRRDGVWPATRFELFERAIDALAHEHDPQRVLDPRPRVEEIIADAERLCFYLLATGARRIWLSNALATGVQAEGYVTVDAIGVDRARAAFALDTAIFRGEGQSFEPSHRTVAEFLAGRYLAGAVSGSSGSLPFPLGRAAALITGNDRKAPSELRGLYAWFAAGLSQKGDETGAIRLIERDAATVLAYGDAAAFKAAGRKAILNNLDRDDPYFLSSRDGATVLGGLASDDLVDEFIAILDSDAQSHLKLTVLEALGDGLPLVGMQAKLHEISIAPTRPHWQRLRTSEAWIKGQTDPTAARRQLFREIAATPVNYDQVSLRANLLSGIKPEQLQLEEIRGLLSDLDRLPPVPPGESEDSGALLSLMMGLMKSPRSDLFDQPMIGESDDHRGHKVEVRHFLQQTLSSAIASNLDIDARTLWSWIRNTREYEWERIDDDLSKSINAWIGRDTDQRELDLFTVLMESSEEGEGAWMATNHFITIARRLPSDTLIENLINLAESTPEGPYRRRLLEVAAYAVRTETHWPIWEKRIVETLEKEGGFGDFITSLRTDPNRDWKEKEAKRQAKELADNEEARAHNIADMTPKMNAIAAGRESELGVLRWASQHYRNAVIRKKEDPLAKIEKYTNDRIKSAIAEGFVQFAIHADIKLTSGDLGKAEAENRAFHNEYVVAAGIHQAILAGRDEEISECPPVTAIVALRQNYFSGDEKPSLANWAMGHLARDAAVGKHEILNYWNAALDAGDSDLDAIHYLSQSNEHELVSEVLKALLKERPNLPPAALRQALSASAQFLTRDEILELVANALGGTLDAEATGLWSFIDLALDPVRFAIGHSREAVGAALLAPNGDLVEKYNQLSLDLDQLDYLRIAALGGDQPAEERDWANPDSSSRIVRAAINRLSASSRADAGKLLKALIPGVDPSWSPVLSHAAAEHASMLRDSMFVAPTASQLKAALSGGPPANAADLAAVVMEEIERYRASLRTGSEMPWKRYWNTDHTGAATKPQIENEDRDRLLELLRSRLERYGVAASLPEARRAENTRADVLLLTHAGKNLPVEAKRHYNPELWSAPIEQLTGYAADEGAFGYGIYLVFWFGSEYRVPARRDRKEAPATAEELQTMLVDDLPSESEGKISVIVLDVARPNAGEKRKKALTRKKTSYKNAPKSTKE